MNKSAQISAAILLATTAGLATAGSLDADRAYASELKADAATRSSLNVGNANNIEVEVDLTFTYSYNDRSGASLGDDGTTVGFALGEAQVRISGDVTENMSATVSFDFGPEDGVGFRSFLGSRGGSAILEDAFVDWEVNDSFSLRIGQFIPNFSSEANTSERNTLSLYRSVSHEFLNTPSWTQGVEAHFGGDNWAGTIGFTDGFGAGNTGIADLASSSSSAAAEADYAFHARFDYYSDSDQARFNDQTSWKGSSNAWRVGGGIAFATVGDTNPAFGGASGVDGLFWNIDAAFEGDGWTVRAAVFGTSIDPDGGTSFDDMGFEIGGSVFMSDQWELFARYDMMILDDNGAGLIGAGVDDSFSFVGIGANYYFVPESHAAKFTVDATFTLDDSTNMDALMGGSGSNDPDVTGVLGLSD
ncbi:MAG: hypothetical protein JKY96_09305, partial [Phycisphaerales bacterium]|nr:hypothetical protein [Phycisphaerales bacterium]